MSLENLNQFPLEILSMNSKSFQLTLPNFLTYFFIDRKRISNFFSVLKSSTTCNNSNSTDQSVTKLADSELEEKKDYQIVPRVETELVLRSLGMFCNSEEEKLPEKLDADEIFKLFEEEKPKLEEVKGAFDVFDKNGDGFVDAEELQNVLCVLGLNEGLEIENCRRMIGVFDVNGDGRIDFDEFIQFMENVLC